MKILEILDIEEMQSEREMLDDPYLLSVFLIAMSCKDVDTDPEPLYDEDILRIFKAIELMLKTLPEEFEDLIKLREQLKERIIDRDTCIKVYKDLDSLFGTAMQFVQKILPHLVISDTIRSILDDSKEEKEEIPRSKRTRKLEL